MTVESVIGYFYLRKAGLTAPQRIKHTGLTEEECAFIDTQRFPKEDAPCMRICTNIVMKWNHFGQENK